MSPVVIVLLARQVLPERLHRSPIAAVALCPVAAAGGETVLGPEVAVG
jgi:hypothetical protein